MPPSGETVRCITPKFGSDEFGNQGMRSRKSGRSAEPQARSLLRLLRLDLAVARRRLRMQRRQQPPRGVGNFDDRALERRLVGLRRLVEAGQLAHELQRRGLDFLLGRGRLEIEQGLDVAAHDAFPWLAPTRLF